MFNINNKTKLFELCKKNIDLIIDGVKPEKVMYDMENHSLEHVVENLEPKFKIGDKVIVKNIKGIQDLFQELFLQVLCDHS